MLTKKIIAPLTTLALSGAFLAGAAAPSSAATPVAAPAAASSTQTLGTASSTINQTIANVGTFTGSFTPTGFSNQNGQLAVTGVLQGTLTTLSGSVVPVTQTLTTTVTSATTAPGSCNVLNLQLGPLHLDVLGLVVDLNQVNLDITAQQGAGNLLGNLLCSVTNLLNGGTALGGLSTLLNQLLGL